MVTEETVKSRQLVNGNALSMVVEWTLWFRFQEVHCFYISAWDYTIARFLCPILHLNLLLQYSFCRPLSFIAFSVQSPATISIIFCLTFSSYNHTLLAVQLRLFPLYLSIYIHFCPCSCLLIFDQFNQTTDNCVANAPSPLSAIYFQSRPSFKIAIQKP